MTAIELESAAALAEIYENDFVDAATGRQAESVQVDGKDIPGQLSFDKSEIDLMFGGWNENLTGVFLTRKAYFPGGYPEKMKSVLSCLVGGRIRDYQVTGVNEDNNNVAGLTITVGKYNNRK